MCRFGGGRGEGAVGGSAVSPGDVVDDGLGDAVVFLLFAVETSFVGSGEDRCQETLPGGANSSSLPVTPALWEPSVFSVSASLGVTGCGKGKLVMILLFLLPPAAVAPALPAVLP